jgi:2-amino-4-hydroxy-6-hydroxymethyldihydropteridine diphosphokinase
MPTACIGLGGNLGDAARTLASAARDMRQLPQTRLLALSSLYTSRPLGPAGQPDYLNAVACLATGLTPHALLAALQAIEDRHGRVRQERWGARTLDLDLLLYGNDILTTPDLVVPHPELENRNFVLIPLLEACPGLRLPDGRPLSALPAAGNSEGLSLLRPGPAWGD